MYLETPPSVVIRKFERIRRLVEMPPDPKSQEEYLHWDKLRRLDPPGDLTSEEWWWKIKFERRAGQRRLPLTDPKGRTFSYGLPDSVLRSLRHVDRRCSGEVAMDEVVTSERHARERYLVNSLMEEAIRSSQLEGATTSRRVAKELLRSGREPEDRSERMIANNFRALQFMRNEIGGTLTPHSILELHRIVTDDTLDDPSAAGRLQRPDEERVAVFDSDEGSPIHKPPPAEQLPERMRLLCEFANEGEDAEQFIHPVIRAIVLHFWLAYDHPFEDGNGRTARILFFWSMREQGYWLVEYLPISKILRGAPAQYARSFVEAETDEGDTTYFLVHQLRVIERALEELHRYLRRKTGEIREIERLLHGNDSFNHRQLAILSDAIRHPDRTYTLRGHADIHRVTHETARSDLGQIVDWRLMRRRRAGRGYVFEPMPGLPSRLKESTA
jgi:Fic family protein